MSICEIRVPTFRRPKLLARALKSVAAQTYHGWQCIVFDDCCDGSAKPLVDAMMDPRFQYHQNPVPLSAIGNIDQCFRNFPFAQGEFACVLEDDNYLLPEHLSLQFGICQRHQVLVTFSAQQVEEIVQPGEPGRLREDKTLAWIYPEGRYQCNTLRPAVLFSHAFSNGAVFWRIGCASDFEIGDWTRHPGIQETLRILKLQNDVYVSHTATAVWRSNDPRDSYVSRPEARGRLRRFRARWSALAKRGEVRDYRNWYIRRYGLADALYFARCISPAHAPVIERAVLQSGRYIAISTKSMPWRLAQIAKGVLFRAVVWRKLAMHRIEHSKSVR